VTRALPDEIKLEERLRQTHKMEAVGRLAGGVAHDFNNMLSVILGNVEVALASLDASDPLHDRLQEIEEAAVRSADLTRQLLAFARRQVVSPEVLDLNETVAGMLTMLRRLIGENIDLTWRPTSDLWRLRIDRSQVDQLLANLCVNARDAIDGVGRVTIATANAVLGEAFCSSHEGAVAGDYVCLTVADDGVGMDADTIARIFEPFFTTKERGRGAGLGLATVYGIVKQNDGYVEVVSDPNEGSTFSIFLPRCAGQVVAARSERSADAASRGHEAILLVEDEPPLLQVLQRMLEGLGYRVLAAHSPSEALDMAARHREAIDLIVTDVVMPEMNGVDLTRRLAESRPGMKHLFISGHSTDAIGDQRFLDADVHFLQKPFPVTRLAAVVRAILDET
jgi:nitrogen-specific signal transduction histidine kinase/ActR/RegA family two-component response regulator